MKNIEFFIHDFYLKQLLFANSFQFFTYTSRTVLTKERVSLPVKI